MSYKPEGYQSVSPYLIVNGAQATIDFLKKVFDAEVLRVHPGEDGRLAHAEVRIDDSVLMFTDAVASWPAVNSHVHVYVEDVHAIYARALEAGATSLQEPVKKDDDDKRGGFSDPGGTSWWVGQQVGQS